MLKRHLQSTVLPFLLLHAETRPIFFSPRGIWDCFSNSPALLSLFHFLLPHLNKPHALHTLLYLIPYERRISRHRWADSSQSFIEISGAADRQWVQMNLQKHWIETPASLSAARQIESLIHNKFILCTLIFHTKMCHFSSLTQFNTKLSS